jgi:GNAT superfamily N-acetyltransferase
MQQLRPHFTDEERFVEQVLRQMKEGFQLAFFQEESEVRAVVGFRFLEFLAWGKVLYVDDLITDRAFRKKGCGSALLQWLIAEAKKKQCDQVHLDSGPQRHEGHRLYLNCGFKIIGYHFALEVQNENE